MKKNKYVLLSMAVIACILSFVSSCKEEEPVNMAPVLELYGTGEVMRQSVLMMGSISGNMGQVKNFGFQYSISDKFPSDQIGLAPAIDGSGAGDFHVHVLGLKANTTYFYRAYATTGAVEVYSHIDQFTTLASSAPRITHLATGEIGEDMVSFFCRIDEVGDEYLYEYGIQYRKSGTTDPYISVKAEGIDEGYHYEVTVSGLEAETIYEFRPYAQNSDTPNGENGFRVGYGGEFTVKTARQQSAIVAMESIEEQNIGMTSLTVSATANLPEGSDGTVEECGFCYSSTSRTPNLADDVVTVDFPGLGKTYKATLTGLSYSTPYYVRAYAKNKVNGELRVGYSEVFQVTTKSLNIPIVIWVSSELEDGFGYSHYVTTPNTIRVTAKIDNYEEGLLKEKGVIWSKTNYNISIEEAKEAKSALTLDTKGESIDGTITNLESNTSYYVRAYAVYEVDGDKKEGYSDYSRISTSSLQAATLNYPNYADVTYHSANLSCEIESEGNGTIKERGFLLCEYNDVSNPTLETTRATKYVVDGVEFSAKAEGLKYSTYYALRAYVISELGDQSETIYSSTRTFNTASIKDATFYNTTIKEDSTTYQSLTVNGGINELGDGELIERGFCWYPYDYYTSYFESRDSMAVTTGTDAEFSLKIEGLKPDTRYYVRAYAKKKAGKYEIVSYDDNYEYARTKSIAGATFNAVTFVEDSTTYHSLKVKGGISDLGDGELIEKGFCWYNSNYSFESRDSMAVATGINADFSMTIDGLDPNTHYYVRSYAKTKIGDKEIVSYSSTYGASTNNFTLSFVSLFTDSVSYDSFVVKSGITAVNEGTLVEKGFCWKQGGTPSLDDNLGRVKIEDGTMDAFSYKIEDLIPGKSYYVRTYAKVKVGEIVYVTYGDYSYVYTTSLDYKVKRTPYDTTCDMEVTFTDNEVPVTAVYVYVTTDRYNSNYWTSNPDLSNSAKFTLTKDEESMKFTGVIDQLKESTTYYYDVYYQCNGQEVYLNYGNFSTGRVPGIDDAVSPDKKE